MDLDQTAPLEAVKEQSVQGPHCLPVCKNRSEKFARIFSRRHKQTTFSDADFLGVLRVNNVPKYSLKNEFLLLWLVQYNGNMSITDLKNGMISHILNRCFPKVLNSRSCHRIYCSL